MQYAEFRQRVMSALPPRTVLQNPGGGTTTIISYTDTQIVYLRGRSRMYVSMADLYGALRQFRGTLVTSSDLKEYAPHVFASTRGSHSCNCTVFFMALRAIGLATKIEGRGRRGSPFQVTISQ